MLVPLRNATTAPRYAASLRGIATRHRYAASLRGIATRHRYVSRPVTVYVRVIQLIAVYVVPSRPRKSQPLAQASELERLRGVEAELRAQLAAAEARAEQAEARAATVVRGVVESRPFGVE